MEDCHWVECSDCGLLQRLPEPKAGHDRQCGRCGRSFGVGLTQGQTARALALTAMILFMLANVAPFMGLNFSGRDQTIHLGSGVEGLAERQGLLPVALFVLAIAILAPLGRMLALGTVLIRLQRNGRPKWLAHLLRFSEAMRPWAMLDVFLVGALVSLTKLNDLASVSVGIGFYTLGALVIVLALLDVSVDRGELWHSIEPAPASQHPPAGDWRGCLECGLVQEPSERCSRCHARLHKRKPDSLQRATALVLAGFILYLPANLYPVLTVISLGRGHPATIMQGVIELMDGTDWPLAVIVFTASVAVPLLKLFGLSLLIVSTHLQAKGRLSDRTKLYRAIEFVGRWSTVDVIVAALLTALVTLGNLAHVEPGVGVLAFAGVVFVTMLATGLFDPRLLWDEAGANDG